MTDATRRIAENLAAVRERIAAAAARSGRRPEDITLVGVAKYVGPAATRCLVEAGCRDIGESRPQQLWQKAEALADLDLRWHLIGHLQRNKVRRTLPAVHWLHSGDSLRLLRSVSDAANELGRPVRLLLEVNISGDADKHGFDPDQLELQLPELLALPHLEILGLMAMSGRLHDADETRRDYARLRELRDRLQRQSTAPPDWDELSMGMSRDFEIAVEEGATVVRVGSALFEGIDDER